VRRRRRRREAHVPEGEREREKVTERIFEYEREGGLKQIAAK
jgi:hypothetical protein